MNEEKDPSLEEENEEKDPSLEEEKAKAHAAVETAAAYIDRIFDEHEKKSKTRKRVKARKGHLQKKVRNTRRKNKRAKAARRKNR